MVRLVLPHKVDFSIVSLIDFIFRRSSGFWNPTVVKYAKEEIVVKEVQK